MKKIVYLFSLMLALQSCGSYRSFNLNKLRIGMSKEQVIATVGYPERVLAVNDSRQGYQEILGYRTHRDEIYALEFWDDYLTGYEFLYDEVQYVPAPRPPYFPEYGRPIVVIPGRPGRPDYNRPRPPSRPENNRPGRPSGRPDINQPVRPGERPGTNQTDRPGTNQPGRPTDRPDNNNPGNRPAERPEVRPAEPTRPATRPVPASENNEPSTRPTTKTENIE